MVDLLWNAKVEPILCLVGFGFCMLFSLVIALGEFSLLNSTMHRYLSPIGAILEAANSGFTGTLVLF